MFHDSNLQADVSMLVSGLVGSPANLFEVKDLPASLPRYILIGRGEEADFGEEEGGVA